MSPVANCAVSGIRFQANGDFQFRQGELYISQANMWVNDSAIGVVNGSLYECRYSNVTGDTTSLIGPATNTWHSLNVGREWSLFACDGFFNYKIQAVSGTIEVREIANPSNIKSGHLTLTATWEGLL